MPHFPNSDQLILDTEAKHLFKKDKVKGEHLPQDNAKPKDMI